MMMSNGMAGQWVWAWVPSSMPHSMPPFPPMMPQTPMTPPPPPAGPLDAALKMPDYEEIVVEDSPNNELKNIAPNMGEPKVEPRVEKSKSVPKMQAPETKIGLDGHIGSKGPMVVEPPLKKPRVSPEYAPTAKSRAGPIAVSPHPPPTVPPQHLFTLKTTKDDPPKGWETNSWEKKEWHSRSWSNDLDDWRTSSGSDSQGGNDWNQWNGES